MYLAGASHPNKQLAMGALLRLATDAVPLVTDAEVFQEVLHRYTAIRRAEAIKTCFDLLNRLTQEVYSIDKTTVESARSILHVHAGVSARDAIHVAVMQQKGIATILSFEEGYDLIPGITRITA